MRRLVTTIVLGCGLALAIPAGSLATLTEVGVIPATTPATVPSCPTPSCLAVSRTTGFQVKVEANNNTEAASREGTMLRAGLIDGADFDLDFHAIMHWGEDPALEKHYVPSRSQRTRSVLTFFAQDAATRNLIFANADISKATQAREVIAFCEHWRALTGTDPGLLVFDQKLTTQAVLAELDERRVTFMTLRCAHPP